MNINKAFVNTHKTLICTAILVLQVVSVETQSWAIIVSQLIWLYMNEIRSFIYMCFQTSTNSFVLALKTLLVGCFATEVVNSTYFSLQLAVFVITILWLFMDELIMVIATGASAIKRRYILLGAKIIVASSMTIVLVQQELALLGLVSFTVNMFWLFDREILSIEKAFLRESFLNLTKENI